MRERKNTRTCRRKAKAWRSLPALLLAGLLSAGGVRAWAQEAPDPDREGSISGTMLHGDSPVGGGTLVLYQAGEITWSEGEGYRFVLTEDFAGSGVSLDDPEDAALAGLLAEYAEGQGLEGVTLAIGEDGSWKAEGLSCGLYLIVQDQAAEGYMVISPFLASIPFYDESSGSWVYDTDAQPKMETVTAEDPPEEDVPEEEEPAVPSGKLPQTGQLNWPVPVLALAGMVLFALGRRMKRKDREETACGA